MEISEKDINKLNDNKKSLVKLIEEEKFIDNNLKNEKFKVSLLNVDSKDRNLIPKNFTKNNNFILSNNPIETKINDSKIKIYYPNHEFIVGDLITINDVTPLTKSLSSSFFLYNNLNYLIILLEDHNIPVNYKDYIDEIFINIDLISDPEEFFYKTIPVNMLLTLKKINTYNEVLTTYLTQGKGSLAALTAVLQLELNNRNISKSIFECFIFVELEFTFLNSSLNLFKIEDVFKISFQNLNGIPSNLINSDYPVNYTRLNGYKEIISTETDYITVDTNSNSFISGKVGGNKVKISKIIRTEEGYPNAGEFVLQLRKNFNNIFRLEIISSEFPFTNYLVRENINSKIYWQHLDDGNYIYSINIPSGNYAPTNLISTIKEKMNTIERISSTPQNRSFNNFDITFDTFTNKVEFKAFSDTLLPNSITDDTITLNNKEYTKLTIKHLNNFVKEGDSITITNSEAINVIPKASINRRHIVYSVNKADSTYSVLLEPFTPGTSVTDNKGGPGVRVKSGASVRFRFDFDDTLGEILNFLNPGDQFSITKFDSVINNFDKYIFSTELDSVGNLKNNKTFIQLTGDINYWLLYLNNYESIILNSGLDNCFSKILLPGSQGDIIFNSFINNPVDFEVPLSSLSELDVRVTDANGKLVDFQNTNFSFTLKIYELVSTPITTGKLAKETNFEKELVQKIKKDNLSHGKKYF